MSDFNKSLTVVCPAELIDEANHMVNCFESCYPGRPILGTPEDPEATHVTVRVSCTEQFVSATQAIVAMGALPTLPEEGEEPSPLLAVMKVYDWNSQNEEGDWLVDFEQANYALSNTVFGSTEEDYDPPEDKIILYSN